MVIAGIVILPNRGVSIPLAAAAGDTCCRSGGSRSSSVIIVAVAATVVGDGTIVVIVSVKSSIVVITAISVTGVVIVIVAMAVLLVAALIIVIIIDRPAVVAIDGSECSDSVGVRGDRLSWTKDARFRVREGLVKSSDGVRLTDVQIAVEALVGLNDRCVALVIDDFLIA